EEGSLVVRRILKKTGRGGIFIGASPASLPDLQSFAALLVDLHSQHEHQSLFSVENHRRFLDRYAGLEERVGGFTQSFSELAEARKKYEELLASERDRDRETELLAFAVQEIGDAALKEDEEEQLLQERKILHEHEKLTAHLKEAAGSLAESDGGALSLLRKALAAVKAAAAIDGKLGEAQGRLENLFFELEDVSAALRAREPGSFNPGRLEALEERLSLIHKLKKKYTRPPGQQANFAGGHTWPPGQQAELARGYGDTLAAVIAYREEAEKKLQMLTNIDEEKNRREADIKRREQDVFAEAAKISDARKAAAAGLEKEIEAALGSLGMKRLRFSVPVEKKESAQGKPVCGPYGLDAVSFLFAPNPGEPLKPLKAIASGGELSRVMLAIKTILAKQDDIGCLIFDEIDSGIGGEVAVAAGEFLAKLAAHKQVLAITHLASIAAQAHSHLRVEKRVEKDRTFTDIVSIEGKERIREIARMLSGEPEGTASMSHAEELLKKYSYG
ncbi:MAG: DNA repair protein RecN, partial [Spirochaetaceae bacterium]|nr:DNA repair protein RecN [Spirochaetaceae bacterium]